MTFVTFDGSASRRPSRIGVSALAAAASPPASPNGRTRQVWLSVGQSTALA